VDPETVAAIIKAFEAVPGIGPAEARSLFDAGYRSLEELKAVPADELAKVEGLSEATAKKVLEALGHK
jgi:excinuclease UvrABC nuclease subunit